MLELSESNIHLNATATNKLQAIEMAASALEQAGNVEQDYLQGMLGREQQTSTFLGNGIAIPHGTLETRSMVKKTGVQVFQFPQGIEWGEGNIAYVVIGIAARSDEHLTLLRQLTHVLGDEDTAVQLATLTDIEKFRAILLGKSDAFSITEETLSLDIETQSLLTLTAINAGKLQQQSAVENSFVSEVVSNSALPLGKGLWVTDAVSGNVKNALAFSRAKTIFNHNGKAVKGVLTISAVNDQINETLARLLDDEVQNILLSGNTQQILTALNGGKVPASSAAQSEDQIATGAVIGTFTVRNEHGLHARPSAVLVNEVKKFTSKITVQNLTRETAPVSAKSLMKIVALGVTQGHRLRFVAEGDDAKQAIEALGKIIASGLGESVSAVPPTEPDTIEVSREHAPQIHEENTGLPADAIEAVFMIRNEHGLHARPSAVLVNEVKKFTSKITVQNLTRETAPVSAKSLMKIVALGVTQGHRLRFVAEGDDAKQAIEALGKIIASGLGEAVSAVPPAEPDTIEVSSEHAPQIHEEKTGLPADAIEAVFMIRNEHGLHARPSAVLVNEVKKYNASVAVQNLDRDSQLVSAKSLMKIVALGVVKGHRLRFVASGEEAQQAIDGIGAVIESGLGEGKE